MKAMDWPSVAFGAFMSLSAFVFLNDCALHLVLRRKFFFWHAIRTLLIAVMALGASNVALGPALSDDGARLTIAAIAGDLSIAALAIFILHFIETEYMQGVLRRTLIIAVILSVGCAALTPFVGTSAILDAAYFVLTGGALIAIFGTLVGAVVIGSRFARYLLAAMSLGFAAAAAILVYGVLHEAIIPNVLWLIMPALALEFFVTIIAMAKRFVVINRERDAAFKRMRVALKANRTDPLTGLPNRRALERLFNGDESPAPQGIAIVDLDHFKQVNDRFGHAVGDEVLVAVGKALGQDDVFAARLGGEEFILVLYGKDWAKQAERARQGVTGFVRNHVPSMLLPVTASAGLASVRSGDDLSETMKRADLALYAAKQAGRDRSLALTFFDEHLPQPPAHRGQRFAA